MLSCDRYRNYCYGQNIGEIFRETFYTTVWKCWWSPTINKWNHIIDVNMSKIGESTDAYCKYKKKKQYHSYRCAINTHQVNPDISDLTAQTAHFTTETIAMLSKSFCPPSIEAPLPLRLLFFSSVVPLLIYTPISFILDLSDVSPYFSVLSTWWHPPPSFFFTAAMIWVCFTLRHKIVFSFFSICQV